MTELPRAPGSPQALDLDRDTLLEASAGTGKTWTLTRLVIRLILEKKMPVEKILVVTYTEKAAGDMKERLRILMEETLATRVFLERPLGEPELAFLREQALHYDRAAVQTIHAFCRGALQRYAFENGFHFEMEQVDDATVAGEALRSLLDGEFAERYGENLEALLALAGANPGTPFSKPWAAQVTALAGKAHPGHTLILPVPGNDLAERWTTAAARLAADLRTAGPHAAKLTAEGRRAVEKGIRMLAQDAPLYAIQLELSAKQSKFAFMKKHADDGEAAATIESLRETLSANTALGMELFAALARRTREETRRLKETRRQISFDDMLVRLGEGLDRPDGLLLASLRRQYSAALVDEFQDTDPVQWEIFRRVFLDSRDHLLCIIGDPKQAIYGFRGADINTYYLAARSMAARGPAAACLRLPVNYRSTPEVIRDGNRFFQALFAPDPAAATRQEWTPFSDTEIPDKPRNTLSGNAAACGIFRNSLTDSGAAETRVHAARAIAADCLGLLAAGILVSLDGAAARPLRPDDICVLARKKKTTILVERELTARGLPCTIYKKEGIYGSSEALHILLVLRHLADPDDNDLARLALLTRFFEREEGALPSRPAPESAAGRFLTGLTTLARRRRWGELFRVLLEDSGIMLREYPLPDGPRRVTNLEQVCQALETAALAGGFDIHRLAGHLRRLVNGEAETAEDETLHRIEDEEPRIRIMTVHAAKGLEFPFVHVLMPLEGEPENKDPWLAYGENGKRIFDLTKAGKAQYRHETGQEKKRLVYVALTRGMFRTVVHHAAKHPAAGAKPPADDDDDGIDYGLLTALDSDWPAEAGDYRPSAQEPPLPLPEPLFAEPVAFLADGYHRRRIQLASFSSLAGHVDTALAFGETGREADEPEAPLPEAEGTILLPRGPKTGNLLHELFEKVDFASAQQSLEKFTETNRVLFSAAVFRNRLKPASGWKAAGAEAGQKELVAEIGRLLHNALTVPLADRAGQSFRLCDLPKEAMKQELEFHFPMGEAEAARITPRNLWFAKGFITGFIDLVFRRDGFYYILDWKSNWLPAYDAAGIEKGMTAHNYHLQASIYSEALRRWLAAHDLPAGHDSLGCVYYLFLRGITGEGAGVRMIDRPKPFPALEEAARG